MGTQLISIAGVEAKVDLLLARLTEARAGDLDQIDALLARLGGVRQLGAGRLRVVPNLAGPITLTSGTPAYTYGAYAQITAGVANAIYLMGLMVGSVSAHDDQIDIATGGAGAESPKIETAVRQRSDAGTWQTLWVPAWVPVAANVRIAARVAGDQGTSQTTMVKLLYIHQADVEGF